MRGVEYESFEGSGSLTQGDGFCDCRKEGEAVCGPDGEGVIG